MNELSFNRDDGPAVTIARTVASEGEEQPTSVPILVQYLRIAVRWKWLIIASIAIAVLVAVMATLLATPLYTAATRIEINREGSRIVNVADLTPDSAVTDVEFYQTQYGILNSRSLAERVARDLRLPDNQRFFDLFGSDEISESFTGRRSSIPANRRLQTATDILLANVEISPIRMSRLVDIAWTSPDPHLSAQVANAWSASFISYNLERRFEATAYARRFLEQRLAEIRGRLEESERRVVAYASNQAIINIPVSGTDAAGRAQERSLTADTLAALNSELAQATADRIRAQSRLQRGGGGASTEALANPAISALRQRRTEAAAEYSRLMTQFEPQYPAAQALAAQIRQLDQSIGREEARVRDSLRNAYQDSVERERSLADRVRGLQGNFLDQRRRSIQYNIFQRDADTNRELYNGLLQRYKEIGVAGGVGENNVAIVDDAEVPKGPSHPRPLINLLLALTVGTVLGVGLALAREQIDETIRDPAELEKMVGLPLLGAVPRSEGDPLSELRDPKSSLVEAYLSIQTSLGFTTTHGLPKTLTVTSTRPAEGKSTTAIALAYSFARNGARTLLVDGDMRSPSLHHELNLDNKLGLSNYLSGSDELSELIRKPGAMPFLALTAGPQPPNAAELLRGDRLDAFMAELSGRFDHVVIDSPPVMGLADAPMIASRTEGTIFVVEAHGIKARVVNVALRRLRQAHARLLGTVLTKFEAKRAYYGYGYEYGYGYGRERTGQAES